MVGMQPDMLVQSARGRKQLRHGLVCCLMLLLLAPLPSVATFALANLAPQCEEHPTEKAGSEHETPHWTHRIRRHWLPHPQGSQPGLILPAHTPGDGTGLPPTSLQLPDCALARPCAGAGVRARC